MTRRSKILSAAVVGVAFLLLLDKVFLAPYTEKWKKISAEAARLDQELLKARTILAREKVVKEGWTKVKGLLDKPRVPDVQTHFVAHLGEIANSIGANFDITGGRDQQQGDFREYIYDTKFKLKWEQLGELLVALNNSREFLKPMRVAVGSQYEKEDRLDVDLKISTVEYSPVKAK
jgi:hypothetical protein